MIIDKINCPKDLKEYSINELVTLSDEMKELIVKKVNTIGGHCASNLGITEMTIALHYVFNSPVDKFVFDVSHQCYPHKMITGRKDGFLNPENYLKYTGYTAPEESQHDVFKIGHTSTSISLATGLAKARDLKNEKYNIIAIIGDGSLSGGQAFEGLDMAAELGSNFIVIVNDNDMSIAPNQGGVYKNLRLLRETNGLAECNFFKSLGFKYRYLDDGNDIEKLISFFNEVKDINSPIVLHIKTIKGKGYKPAEDDKERFHWIMPNFMNENGELISYQKSEDYKSYCSVTNDYLLKMAKTDSSIIAITPATPGVYEFTKDFREKLGKQYIDVGIAEEHAVAYASGLAKNGAKPILAVMSSFIQRTYDQISQDLCLNNSPITLLIHWGGISGADATHLCCFDIPMLSNIPNLVYLSPVNVEEYLAMLKFSVEKADFPIAIRVPNGNLISCGKSDDTDYSKLNKYKVESSGEKIAIIGLGNFFHLGRQLKNELIEKLNINPTLINPKFITGVDEELLQKLKENHELIITLEDGVLDGGFGEKITRFYGNSKIKVLNFGAKKEFTDRVPLNDLYERYHLTKELILEDIKTTLNL